jgi:hypothetical protein
MKMNASKRAGLEGEIAMMQGTVQRSRADLEKYQQAHRNGYQYITPGVNKSYMYFDMTTGIERDMGPFISSSSRGMGPHHGEDYRIYTFVFANGEIVGTVTNDDTLLLKLNTAGGKRKITRKQRVTTRNCKRSELHGRTNSVQ